MPNDFTVPVLKSLADDIRLSIVRKLVNDNHEVACATIVASCSEFLNLSQPTMSHHFNRLVKSGVLLERKVGTEKYYHINRDLLTRVGIDPSKL